eukprot:6240417-Amphidinium_carterae.1
MMMMMMMMMRTTTTTTTTRMMMMMMMVATMEAPMARAGGKSDQYDLIVVAHVVADVGYLGCPKTDSEDWAGCLLTVRRTRRV